MKKKNKKITKKEKHLVSDETLRNLAIGTAITAAAYALMGGFSSD